jgi:hypothetical protein
VDTVVGVHADMRAKSSLGTTITCTDEAFGSLSDAKASICGIADILPDAQRAIFASKQFEQRLTFEGPCSMQYAQGLEGIPYLVPKALVAPSLGTPTCAKSAVGATINPTDMACDILVDIKANGCGMTVLPVTQRVIIEGEQCGDGVGLLVLATKPDEVAFDTSFAARAKTLHKEGNSPDQVSVTFVDSSFEDGCIHAEGHLLQILAAHLAPRRVNELSVQGLVGTSPVLDADDTDATADVMAQPRGSEGHSPVLHRLTSAGETFVKAQIRFLNGQATHVICNACQCGACG